MVVQHDEGLRVGEYAAFQHIGNFKQGLVQCPDAYDVAVEVVVEVDVE